MLNVFKLEKFYYVPKYDLVIEANDLDIEDINNIVFKYLGCRTINKFNSKTRLIIGNKYYGNSATIIISNKCMLKCKYCYSSSGTNCNNSFLSFNKYKKIVNILINNAKIINKKTPWIDLTFHGGGEPTYNFSLLKRFIQYAIKKCKENNTLCLKRIITNGFFSINQAKWLSENFNEVCFSIDGPSEINGFTRQSISGKDITMIVIKNARYISENNCKVSFNTVLTNKSIGFGEKIAKFFLNNVSKLSSVQFTRYVPTIDGNNFINTISNDEYLNIYKDARKVLKERAKSFIGEELRLNGYCKGTSLNTIYCHPNGFLTSCIQFDKNSKNNLYKIGEINKTIEIDNNNVNNIVKNNNDKLKNCNKCFAFYHCGGGCKAIYDNTNDFNYNWCQLVFKILKFYMIEKLNNSNLNINYKKNDIDYNLKYTIFNKRYTNENN